MFRSTLSELLIDEYERNCEQNTGNIFGQNIVTGCQLSVDEAIQVQNLTLLEGVMNLAVGSCRVLRLIQ